MECSWGLEDLKEARNDLKKALKKERDHKKKKYIRNILESLDYFIEDEQERLLFLEEPTTSDAQNEGTELSECELNNILSNLEYDLVTCSQSYSLVALFSNTIDTLKEKMHEIEDILSLRLLPEEDYSKITGATLTNNQALSLTADFYRHFSSSLYPIFKAAYKNRTNSVRYIDTLENDCRANSFFIDIINRYFINMINNNQISKLYDFIHEYGHVISFLINPKSAYRTNESFFNEVASLFPELVAQHENSANFDPTQVTFESYMTLVSFINKATSLNLHKPIINVWHDCDKNANEEYFRELKATYNIDEEEFDLLINTFIDDDAIYIISYMVAIELLHIYKQDKQQALEIFENFLRIPYDQSILKHLQEKITIGKHLQEEMAELLDTFKLRLKKSGEFNV